MSGKQIAGIILLLIGLGTMVIGGSNVLDLIRYGDNPLVQLGLQAQGTSLAAMWIKYGVITIVGIVMLLVGIKFVKKQPIAVNQ